MTDILFTANGASATALVSGELTSGMVGLPVRFSFDSDWDGLNIVAVFEGSGVSKSVPLLAETSVTVPWECRLIFIGFGLACLMTAARK